MKGDLESQTCSLRSECGTRRLIWRAPDLWAASEGLPVREVPVAALMPLLEQWFWGRLESLLEFAEHMERVRNADLDWPIILSQDGELMDGAHRLVKAYLQGGFVKVVRFEQNPPPWREEVVDRL